MIMETGSWVYLDSNVVIYALTADAQWGSLSRKVLEACAQGALRGCISDAVCAEVLSGPYRTGDQTALAAARRLVEDEDLFMVLSHSREDFRESARLRGERGLGFVDALHVATASNNGCHALITNDQGLHAAQIPLVVPLAGVRM